MLGTYFYHEIIRKTIIAFGTLFNNVNIKHTNDDGRTVDQIKVPLAYAPMQKFLAKIQQQADLNKGVAITLPRMSFEMTGIAMDPTRKTTVTKTFKAVAADGSGIKQVYMPVPYNIDFELGIYCKLNDDALQIVEQILPFFQPHYNLSLKLLPEMNETKDCPVTLQSVDYEDDYEGDFSTRRAIIYTLQFSVKTYLYGPVTDQNKIIKKVVTDYYTSTDTAVAPREVRYTTVPDPITADGDDDFGFGVTKAEFTDDKKRNPVSGQDEAI